ncbi:MAG: methyltransferase domain-containing protein [Candidatus Omnitrophica bacterium]|nr:methyltransferase domain-containing protein [Candidatus Omnitrophota bacterium]MDE2215372.1 methyltransferase domain-containing protein [Candidatus Omnitrophota bacterium]
MAHPEQKEFCERVKVKFPEHFVRQGVLDAGSRDINGNNRYLFEECCYFGLDISPGENIDVVGMIHEFRLGEKEVFDTIISTEVFEHDMFFHRSIARILELLKPDGLFLFTCATDNRPEHGTITHGHESSPETSKISGWDQFYRNIPPEEAIAIGRHFRQWGIEVYRERGDLYFWGKR